MGLRFAMADGGYHHAAEVTPWFTPATALASSAVTAFVVWAGQRLIGKAAWQTAITAANRDLIDQLQEERSTLRDEFDTYKVESLADRTRLHNEIYNLTQALQSLHALLRREGVEVPLSHYRETDGVIELTDQSDKLDQPRKRR